MKICCGKEGVGYVFVCRGGMNTTQEAEGLCVLSLPCTHCDTPALHRSTPTRRSKTKVSTTRTAAASAQLLLFPPRVPVPHGPPRTHLANFVNNPQPPIRRHCHRLHAPHSVCQHMVCAFEGVIVNCEALVEVYGQRACWWCLHVVVLDPRREGQPHLHLAWCCCCCGRGAEGSMMCGG